MKSIFLSLCLIFLSSCAIAEDSPSNSPKTTLLFSPAFSVELPLAMLEDAKIIDFEGIWIKLQDNKSLSGLIIVNGKDSLPKGHDIRKYPRYRFGLDSLDPLPQKEQKMFKGDQSELSYSLNNPEIITYSDANKTYYHACSKTECESYVVKKDVDDQILVLFSNGLGLGFMKSITKGIK